MVIYHARNPEYQDLLIEHAQLIVSRKDMTTEEYDIGNNPIMRFNFNLLKFGNISFLDAHKRQMGEFS